ncbi:hypothetical protein ACU4GD_32005 [Cupriavidus basilensis]
MIKESASEFGVGEVTVKVYRRRLQEKMGGRRSSSWPGSPSALVCPEFRAYTKVQWPTRRIARYSLRMGSSSILRTSTSGAPLISVVDDDESVRSSLVSTAAFERLSEARVTPRVKPSLASMMGRRQPVPGSGCPAQRDDRTGAAGVCEGSLRRTIPIIPISAHRDEEAERRALKAGALSFL